MSAELHRLRNRIRNRKLELRAEIKKMAEMQRKTQKFILKYRQACDPITIQFARDNRKALLERRAALRELISLTN
jgi:predicted ATP-grasp superfamily ATP-dependent carboligase